MVNVSYTGVATGREEDQENAEKVKTIEIQYAEEADAICITVDIDDEG